MSASSSTVQERARKTQVTILRALQEPGRQVALATSMGISESTVSRMKNDQLEQFSELLAHLGLKVVNQEMQCFPPDQIQALLTLSKVHLASIERPDQLIWE
ncbi:CII family transcriptional regulator [Variovorax sp. RA8]|uniref:CII family transcriptional regulator n=1 Tax=Variovorax sp. (strain JCM 16519 / RA8) TaxID=662548 RepID=UPI0022B2A0FC|nr:CII family transcriptional regulator [Variovorax sp. RA8]